MHQMNFKSIHRAKRLRIRYRYLKMGKSVGGTETPILGELISPKNSKILRRNQGITKGGLRVALMVVLVCVRERREKMVKG
jgi:hypothetical protein